MKNFQVSVMIAISVLLSTVTASAQFAKAEVPVYLGWLELEEEYQAGLEYGAYAITQKRGDTPVVLYMIISNFKGKTAVLGAFRCDTEFTVLETFTAGMRDIRCAEKDLFGQVTTTTLRMGENGLYRQIF
jgi:hypothetical protein